MDQNERRLSDQVLSEVSLLELLNIEQPQLDRLRRNKNFPYIRLNTKCRVYLASDVAAWLKERRTG